MWLRERLNSITDSLIAYTLVVVGLPTAAAFVIGLWQELGLAATLVMALAVALIAAAAFVLVSDWRSRRSGAAQSAATSTIYVLVACVGVVAFVAVYAIRESDEPIEPPPAESIATPSVEEVVKGWIARSGVEATALDPRTQAGLLFQYSLHSLQPEDSEHEHGDPIWIYARAGYRSNLLLIETHVNVPPFCYERIFDQQRRRSILDPAQAAIAPLGADVSVTSRQPNVPELKLIRGIPVDVHRSELWFLLKLRELVRAARIATYAVVQACEPTN